MSYFTMSPFGQELNSKKGVDKIKDVYDGTDRHCITSKITSETIDLFRLK